MAAMLVALLVLAQDGAVRVTVEASRLNPSGPMLVRCTIENTGGTPVEIEEPSDYKAAIQIRGSGDKVVKEFGAPASRRLRLDARAFVGRRVDVAPALAIRPADDGFHTVVFRVGRILSSPAEVLIVRDYRVRVETNLGEFSFELMPDTAPRNVMNLVALIRGGFYDGKTIYRVIPGFVVQGGNAKPDGSAVSAKTVKAEFSAMKHEFGTVSMARRADPDSASTDFFICLGAQPSLDGQYTVVGRLAEGDRTLRDIEGVRTDHSPCAGCSAPLPLEFAPGHCMQHHQDRPGVEIIMKKVTLTERKN